MGLQECIDIPMSEILRKEKCQFFSGKIQGYFCCCGWSYFQLSSLCKTREKCTNTSLTQNSKYPSIIIAFRVKCKSIFCWCGGVVLFLKILDSKRAVVHQCVWNIIITWSFYVKIQKKYFFFFCIVGKNSNIPKIVKCVAICHYA